MSRTLLKEGACWLAVSHMVGVRHILLGIRLSEWESGTSAIRI